MKKITLFIFTTFILSCSKDYNSSTSSFINNTTIHTITIVPYSNGVIDLTNRKVILSKENIKVLEKSVRGKTLNPNFGTILQPYDSVVVLFDDSIKSIHLKFNSSSTCTKCISFTNNRNITNESNYIKTTVKEDKHSLEGFFTYTFTEQDYLDAKK